VKNKQGTRPARATQHSSSPVRDVLGLGARAHPENKVKATPETVSENVIAHDQLTFIKSMGPGETDFFVAIVWAVSLLWRATTLCAGARARSSSV